MREKRRQFQRVILQKDNAGHHAAQQTHETIDKVAWEVLLQPPYNTDLALYDFHLIGRLKDALRFK